MQSSQVRVERKNCPAEKWTSWDPVCAFQIPPPPPRCQCWIAAYPRHAGTRWIACTPILGGMGPAPPRRLSIGRTQQAPTGPNQAKRGVGGAEWRAGESPDSTQHRPSGSLTSSSSSQFQRQFQLQPRTGVVIIAVVPGGRDTTTTSTAAARAARAALVHSLTDC